MKILFLDDEEWRVDLYKKTFPRHHVTWITEPWDFVEEARKSFYDILSLDHDLHLKVQPAGSGSRIVIPISSKDQPTGMDAVRGLCEDRGESGDSFIIIHSWNRTASEGMQKAFREIGLEVPWKKIGGKNYFNLVRKLSKGVPDQETFLDRILSNFRP